MGEMADYLRQQEEDYIFEDQFDARDRFEEKSKRLIQKKLARRKLTVEICPDCNGEGHTSVMPYLPFIKCTRCKCTGKLPSSAE